MSVTLRCRTHPKYKAIFTPKSTPKHPHGCAGCWALYNTARCGPPVQHLLAVTRGR